MSNIIFPQKFSITEDYPGDTSMKLYGVIPCAADNICVNSYGFIGRWYTNTIETHNYVNSVDTTFGHYLPALGSNFIFHIVQDSKTGTSTDGTGAPSYPGDLNDFGGLGVDNIYCTTLEEACTETELLEHSNIYDYESCCVGTYQTTDEDGDIDLLSMSFRTCPYSFFSDIDPTIVDYVYGEPTGQISDEYLNYLDESRTWFVKASDLNEEMSLEQACMNPSMIAGEIKIHKFSMTGHFQRWFIDWLSQDVTGFSGGINPNVQVDEFTILRAETHTSVWQQAYDSGQQPFLDDGNGIVHSVGSSEEFHYMFFEDGTWRSEKSYCGPLQDMRNKVDPDSGCPGYTYGGPYGNWGWNDPNDPSLGIYIERNKVNEDFPAGTKFITDTIEDIDDYTDPITGITTGCIRLSGPSLRWDDTIGLWNTTSCVMIGDDASDFGTEFQLPYLNADILSDELDCGTEDFEIPCTSTYLGYLDDVYQENYILPISGLKMYRSTDDWETKSISNFYLDQDGRWATISSEPMRGVWELNRKTERLDLYGIGYTSTCLLPAWQTSTGITLQECVELEGTKFILDGRRKWLSDSSGFQDGFITGTFYDRDREYINLPAGSSCDSGDSYLHTDDNGYITCRDNSKIGEFQTYPLFFTDSFIFEGTYGKNCQFSVIDYGIGEDSLVGGNAEAIGYSWLWCPSGYDCPNPEETCDCDISKVRLMTYYFNNELDYAMAVRHSKDNSSDVNRGIGQNTRKHGSIGFSGIADEDGDGIMDAWGLNPYHKWWGYGFHHTFATNQGGSDWPWRENPYYFRSQDILFEGGGGADYEDVHLAQYFQLSYFPPSALNGDGSVAEEDGDGIDTELWEDVCFGDEISIVVGCTDPSADNYNPDATHNDFSCTYTFTTLLGGYVSPGGNPLCQDLPGDLNYDGTVDVLDVIITVNNILGNIALSQEQFYCADFNNDGVIDVADVIQMVNIILNNISTSNSDAILLKKLLIILRRNDLIDDIKINSVNNILVRSGYHKGLIKTHIRQVKEAHSNSVFLKNAMGEKLQNRKKNGSTKNYT